jgi:hypothetical protein
MDFVALADVVPDECKAGIAAAEFARGGVEHTVARAMHGVKLDLVETFPQFGFLE